MPPHNGKLGMIMSRVSLLVSMLLITCSLVAQETGPREAVPTAPREYVPEVERIEFAMAKVATPQLSVRTR